MCTFCVDLFNQPTDVTEVEKCEKLWQIFDLIVDTIPQLEFTRNPI